MRVISRKDHKLIGNLIADGAYKYVSKFAIEDDKGNRIAEYASIKALYRDFKDYEEPKRTWLIDTWGSIRELEAMEMPVGWEDKPILEFETKEEAEKAAEKLKAWKRLKDGGLVIKKWSHTPDMYLTTGSFLKIEGFIPAIMKNMKDLDLLFGGEE